MANARDVKRRIRSVENTRKITRTMELVATSKLKRATDRVYAAMPYSEALGQIVSSLYAPHLSERQDGEVAAGHQTYGSQLELQASCDSTLANFRGRDPRYRGPPAQIPACGTTALGSCHGSNAQALARVRVMDACSWNPTLGQPLHTLPRDVRPLTATPEGVPPHADDFSAEAS